MVYRVRKYHAPRDKVGDMLRAILGINFSVIYTKIKAKYEAIKSMLGI